MNNCNSDSRDPNLSAGNLLMAVRFLQALFTHGDYVTIRPTEVWEQSGKKRSRVDYKGVRQVRPNLFLDAPLKICIRRTVQEKTNLFFGVCPRFGEGNRFERAWQIRKVVTLWADIDHVTVPDALDRIVKAKLPRPSAVVCSGNGVHVYWFLDAPFLIDDVGNPPPVLGEWGDINGKRRRLEYYVDEHGDRHNLQEPTTGRVIKLNAPDLSPRAIYIQEIVAGIAVAIGGDHTFDLSRLLRVPGTWNRKSQRNGLEPKFCELVEMAETRYSIDQFVAFSEMDPERKRREVTKTVPLPKVRRLSPGKEDKLSRRICACEVAEDRSKADFGLCAFAIENGIDKDEVWERVAGKGKFADRGRDYFDRTWDKAAEQTRCKILVNIEREESRRDTGEPLEFDGVYDQAGNSTTGDIVYNAANMPVSHLLNAVTEALVESMNVYSRAGSAVQVRGEELSPLNDQPSLAAALCAQRELIIEETRGEDFVRNYTPLPAKYAGPWLCDLRQLKRLPPINLYTRCPVWQLTPTGWRLSPPGYDRETAIYYAGSEITPSATTEHLDNLLREFCWRSPADRANYLAMLLTVVLISRFNASKPGLLLNGNQPGVGKTLAAQVISIIRCGRTAPTIAYNDRDEELEKRFGSVVKSGVETIIVDNAKTPHAGEISSSVIDRFITDDPVSFRLLGSSADIRAENSFILAITANTQSVCRDLVSRTIPVNLYFEGDATKRTFQLENPQGYAENHRHEIIAELLGMVGRWIDAQCPLACIKTRFESRKWGATIGGILAQNGVSDFLANADEASQELDPVRSEFSALVEQMSLSKLGIDWTATEMVRSADEARIFCSQLGDGSDRSRVTRLGALASRFIGTRFRLSSGTEVILTTCQRKNGKIYILQGAEP